MQIDGNEWVECIGRIADGDEQAMDFLHHRYVELLNGLIAAIVKREEDVEDVLNQVFRQVRERAAGFDQSKDTVYGWLLAIARDLAMQRCPPAEPGSGPESTPEFLDSHGRSFQRIRTALAEIPEVPRRMIEETYLGGYSQSQIAARMGIPLGRVRLGMRFPIPAIQTTGNGMKSKRTLSEKILPGTLPGVCRGSLRTLAKGCVWCGPWRMRIRSAYPCSRKP